MRNFTASSELATCAIVKAGFEMSSRCNTRNENFMRKSAFAFSRSQWKSAFVKFRGVTTVGNTKHCQLTMVILSHTLPAISRLEVVMTSQRVCANYTFLLLHVINLTFVQISHTPL